MKKLKTKKAVILIAVTLLFIAAYLFYSRPMTIQQRYPMLNLDKCTELRGYYRLDGQVELTEFTIDKNCKEFEMLCDLLYEQDYRRSLRDLLPRGTRIHPTEPGDFEWEVFFYFENVALPDGNIGSGGILRIQCWYGELDIHFDGEILTCYTDEQETWAKDVLNIIQ
ncbi:MAG: hypothetical protein IJ443_09515 [Firmicutes bacterium]|nr:hypothetical protein [Bacillota bacterium]